MMILSQNGKAIASTSNLNYIEVEEKDGTTDSILINWGYAKVMATYT